MSASTDDSTSPVRRLGFVTGQVIQEFGYDDDVDFELRTQVEEIVGAELVDEDYDDVTDGVLIWHRADDGDLGDTLVDAMTVLDDNGPIWVLTPKAGREGHVLPSDVEDAASTTGLHVMTTFSVAPDWAATRVASRGRGK
ncbi:DUF3052 domain-containing protein [Cellulomonas citrea]|uniref:DUF3052 domain-containing protein n=1 Tax=Cellulomonas citrea TaxID=1909423 RepID=UPI00135A6B76|nr:DUF3052 domain-containing protein [Cellulomonas citrea]